MRKETYIWIIPDFKQPNPLEPLGVYEVDTKNWEVVELKLHFETREMLLKLRKKK